MKAHLRVSIFAAATVALALTASHANVALADEPGLVAVPISTIFVPNGFDNNDEVQVVLDGTFPNTCYKLARTEVTPLASGMGFTVKQFARRFSGVCIPTFVPFWTEVTLGRLPTGEHRIVVADGPEAMVSVVDAPSSSQDDFLYAPVETIELVRGADFTWSVKLHGHLTNTCLELGDVRVLDQGEVQVVLPIVNKLDRSDCRDADVEFTKVVALPSQLDSGNHLVHVRSMSGRAINAVFFSDGD